MEPDQGLITLELGLLIAGVLALAAIVASRATHRLGVPSLLVFLALGMLAGSEGPGGIVFYNSQQAQDIGSIALLVILFAGGLVTPWRDIRPVLGPGLALATFGVAITTVAFASFAYFMLGNYETIEPGRGGLGWTDAFLLAAIVSSTDAAAVFAAFSGRARRPKKRLVSILELESGSNDPMAVVLTTTLIVAITSKTVTAGDFVVNLVIEIAGGAILGLLIGVLGTWAVNRVRLPAEGLYPVLVLALGLISFGATGLLGGSPFLAVYLTGLIVGNRIRRSHDSILAFHDGLSWLAQIGVFLLLGLLVTPSQLPSVAVVAIVLATFLMLVARPLAVFLCLTPLRFPVRQMTFISWAGLRGAVPIVLATFPITAGIASGQTLFNVVFFVVIISVLVQGITLAPSVGWLGVSEDDLAKKRWSTVTGEERPTEKQL